MPFCIFQQEVPIRVKILAIHPLPTSSSVSQRSPLRKNPQLLSGFWPVVLVLSSIVYHSLSSLVKVFFLPTQSSPAESFVSSAFVIQSCGAVINGNVLSPILVLVA